MEVLAFDVLWFSLRSRLERHPLDSQSSRQSDYDHLVMSVSSFHHLSQNEMSVKITFLYVTSTHCLASPLFLYPPCLDHCPSSRSGAFFQIRSRIRTCLQIVCVRPVRAKRAFLVIRKRKVDVDIFSQRVPQKTILGFSTSIQDLLKRSTERIE